MSLKSGEVSRKKSNAAACNKPVILSHKRVKRLNVKHLKALEKLIDPKITSALFGPFDLEEMLAKCFLCLGLQDEHCNIIGAMVINLQPNISSLPPWEWNHWIINLYGLDDANSRNTLWIHLLVWDSCYYFMFFKPIVHYLFRTRNFLQYCFLVIPPGKHRIDFLNNLGTVVMPKECDNHRSCQSLYMMCRQDFQLKYKIRGAVEEDNDDLVPLLNTHSTRLQESYGSYYIAELLTRLKEPGRQIIVAEYNGTAVCVLCLNEVVNYKVLDNEFELTPYNGLKKPHPDDFADLSLDQICQSLEQLRSKFEDEILDIVNADKVSYGGASGVTKRSSDDQLLHIGISDSEDYSLVFTSASLFFFQDDDEREKSYHDSEDSQTLIEEYLDKNKQDPRLTDIDAMSGYSISRHKTQKIPEFKGEPNAFCMELAAAQPEHEYGLVMLYEAAFECYPDRDYCIMSLPSTTPIHKLTRYFVRVVPRPTGSFPYELYVMHKCAMLGCVEVQPAGTQHIREIKHLLSTIPNYPMVLQQYENSINIETSLFSAFVFLCDNHVIGVSTLAEESDLTYIQAHYDVSLIDTAIHKTGSFGIIESIIMSPIFQRHSKYFLRELHRLSDFSVLFYRHTPYDTTDVYRERPLNNMLQNLLPIMPRKEIEYDMKALAMEECEPAKEIIQKKDPFALYLSLVPICSSERYSINTKIVVIGCSHTSLAFLETLLFKQDPENMVTFNNLTLVCPNGLSYIKVGSRIRELFLIKKNFMDSRHMDMVSLKTYVNIVQGKITKIDRKEQIVVVNGSSFLSYDLLFLMAGEQFQRPLRANRVPFQEKPENVFVINNAIDANNAVIKLKQLYAKLKDPNYVIIIYGHFLQAHCTLNGLLTFGIPGKNMVLVEPFPYSMALEKRQRHNVSIYNDPDVDQAVYEHIKGEGIKVYSSFYFIDWVYDEADNLIRKARFESRHKMLEMQCMAMFYFNEKEISPRVYRVINDAGLVYDGRLVIDNQCRTNDPKIYGAGTLTKYSRKYWATSMTHKYFNRVEIGQRLGAQIKKLIVQYKKVDTSCVPLDGGWNIKQIRGDHLVPRYEKPLMRYCRLPGGLYYLSVTKPGKRTPLETSISLENYGQVLITGNCKNLNKQGFFRLHLNDYKRVETITCLTKFPIDVYNIYCLWGKHEKLLNNIQLRFEMVLITDLFEFFKEPWAYAIYHDKFNDLMEDLNKLMTSSVGHEAQSLIKDVVEAYKTSNWKALNEDAKDLIDERFRYLSYAKIIEQKVLDFIKTHLDHLPMYAHPIVVRALLRNFENSPLFT